MYTADPGRLPCRPRAVAIGTFDGVHLGHRDVIERCTRNGLVPTVVTFDPHPRWVLGREVDLICSLPRRLELLAEAGVQDVLVLPFTTALARLTPVQFVDRVLRRVGTRRVAVGVNFRFGHRATGDVGTLRDLGLEVDVVDIPSKPGPASSSQVREMVRAGALAAAAGVLGRPWELEGEVFRSPQRTGAPTLAVAAGSLRPAPGRYLGRVVGREMDLIVRVTEREIALQPASAGLPAAVGNVRVQLADDAVVPARRQRLDLAGHVGRYVVAGRRQPPQLTVRHD